jgi:hypothetical protein
VTEKRHRLDGQTQLAVISDRVVVYKRFPFFFPHNPVTVVIEAFRSKYVLKGQVIGILKQRELGVNVAFVSS